MTRDSKITRFLRRALELACTSGAPPQKAMELLGTAVVGFCLTERGPATRSEADALEDLSRALSSAEGARPACGGEPYAVIIRDNPPGGEGEDGARRILVDGPPPVPGEEATREQVSNLFRALLVDRGLLHPSAATPEYVGRLLETAGDTGQILEQAVGGGPA